MCTPIYTYISQSNYNEVFQEIYGQRDTHRNNNIHLQIHFYKYM